MTDDENINEFLLSKLERQRSIKSTEEINITFIKTSSDDAVNTFCDTFFNLLNKNSTKTIGVRVIYYLNRNLVN
jgi:hypothetical protein